MTSNMGVSKNQGRLIWTQNHNRILHIRTPEWDPQLLETPTWKPQSSCLCRRAGWLHRHSALGGAGFVLKPRRQGSLIWLFYKLGGGFFGNSQNVDLLVLTPQLRSPEATVAQAHPPFPSQVQCFLTAELLVRQGLAALPGREPQPRSWCN